MKNDKYIVYFISRTKEKMIKFITENLKSNGLEHIIPSHGNILTVLYENGQKMPLNEISKKIGRDKSTVTPLVNKLVSLGYVKKISSIDDKRITFVELTDKGRDIQDKFDKISKQVYETAYKDFSEEEKKIFLSLLKKINQNFSNYED